MQFIRQSEATAARRRIPFLLVDATDRVTPETGVTVSAGDLKISKAGGAFANAAGTWVELDGGDYYYEPTTGEVDTLGHLLLRFSKTGIAAMRPLVQIVEFPAMIAAIKAVTDNLPDGGTLTSLGADLADVEALLTDPVADSVPADGSRPSIKQALYMLVQFMCERSVSGTTLTVRKPDGSTALMTFTLDSSSAPTSITRAT